MSPRQVSLSAWLLVFACGSTMADTLTLTTTKDENNENKSACSLREAVAYVAQHSTLASKITSLTTSLSSSTITDTEKTKYQAQLDQANADLASLRANGWWGCKTSTEGDTDAINTPPLGSNYLVNSEIVISSAVTIQDNNSDSSTSTDTEKKDSTLTTIQAIGNHRLFTIDNGATDTTISVSINSLNLLGCNSNSQSSCADNGGIIYNKETLKLSYATLNNGTAATNGGAIYNTSSGTVTVDNSSYRNNKASNGAVFYSESGIISISSSLFEKNTGNNILYLNSDSTATSTTHKIITSTFTNNTGTAISAHQNALIRNITAITNTGGIDFNSNSGHLYNSIIANNQQDCINWLKVGSTGYIQNNLFSKTNCVAESTSTDKNYVINGSGEEKLLAGTDSNNTCSAPPALGLLCPLADNGGFTFTYKPRLLAYLNTDATPIIKYTTTDDALIVGKASANSTSTEDGCDGTDQRGKARSSERCDIGAVQLQPNSNDTQGQDVDWGIPVYFDLREKIADGELVGHELCLSLTGHASTIDGCPEIVTAPTKGSISFNNSTHQLVYTPYTSYHGTDEFSYHIMTTISRFNDAINSRTQRLDVKIVSNPPASTKMQSKQTNVGLIGIPILGLLILALQSRRSRMR